MLRALLSAVTLLIVFLVLVCWSGSGASAAAWWQHEQEEEEDFEYDFGGVYGFSQGVFLLNEEFFSEIQNTEA